MLPTALDALHKINVGKDSAYDEEPEYAAAVFVHSEQRKLLLCPDRSYLLFVGGKGSGKTALYLHLKNNPPLNVVDGGGTRIPVVCAFLNAARPMPNQRHVRAFATLASQVAAYVQQHKICTRDAFNLVDANLVQRNWLHLLAYESLSAVLASDLIPEGNEERTETHFRLLAYAVAYKILAEFRRGEKLKEKARKMFPRGLKIESNIPFVPSIEVGHADADDQENKLDPSAVLNDLNDVIGGAGRKLYIVVDTSDEILERKDEDVRLCLLSSLLGYVVNWHEYYPNISIKLFMRADNAMRAQYDHQDRIVSRFSVLRWDALQFQRFILKRLLYSEVVRERVGFLGALTTLDGMYEKDLKKLVERFFGSGVFHLPAHGVHNGGKELVDAVPPNEFLYRYFVDGRGAIPLRHVVSFLQACKNYELTRVSSLKAKDRPRASEPLFDRSTIDRVLFHDIPELVLSHIDEEYPFIRHQFNKLSGLCAKQFFTKQEFMKKISGISITPPETLDTVMHALFYSGLVSGDAKLVDNCNRFWFPIYVYYALSRRISKRAV